MKLYAVKVRVKPKGFKVRTFKGIVSGENPLHAKERAEQHVFKAIQKTVKELQTSEVEASECALYNDFAFVPT